MCEPSSKMLKHLLSYFQDPNNEVLFCNTCNLFGIWVAPENKWRSTIFSIMEPHIKGLIHIAKQKIGNWRKSAAILLGKLAMDPECKKALDKDHGMDVLKSIAHLVVNNKS